MSCNYLRTLHACKVLDLLPPLDPFGMDVVSDANRLAASLTMMALRYGPHGRLRCTWVLS